MNNGQMYINNETEDDKRLPPYKYIQPKKIKKAAIASGVLFGGAAILIIISALAESYAAIYRITSIIFATGAIQITTRFILTNYEILLYGTNFIVTKINGKRATQVCNISLKSALGVEREISYKEVEKKYGVTSMKMNFSQNLLSESQIILIFDFNGKLTTASIQYSPEFFDILKHRIFAAKESDDE